MQFLLLAGALALASLYLPVLACWLLGFSIVAVAIYQSARFQRRPWFAMLLVAGLIVALSPQAFAADTTVAVSGIYDLLLPYIVAAVGAAVSALVGWVLVLVSKKLGVSVDDSMRASLQTAATNAAGLALNRLGNQLAGKTIDVRSAVVAEAVNYVIKAAPDAIRHFGLTPDAIAEKIVALLPQVANTTTTATAKT